MKMTFIRRLVIYCFFFLVYTILSWPITGLQLIFENLYVSLIFGFGLINSIFSYLFLKEKILMNMLVGFTIALFGTLSIYLGLKFEIAPSSDAYGIKTAIISNAIISIILWEITFQIFRTIRRANSNK